MKNNGQILSIDLVFAIAIFISLLIVFNTFWSLFLTNSQYSPQDSIADAQRFMNYLILSPGHPSGWTSSNVQLIGLANPPGVLQQTQIVQLMNLSIGNIQNLTGLSRYNLYFNITYTNGSALSIQTAPNTTNNTVFGTYPINSTNVAYVRGLAIYNNDSKRVIVNVMLWN